MADLIDISVTGVGAQGDGLAPGPLFVPLTLGGETVRGHRDGQRVEVVEIVTASPDRVAPPCPHFGTCGGCSLQHWASEPYLAWKGDLVRTALSHEHIETEILPTFASPPGSRRRLALHARGGKGGVTRSGLAVTISTTSMRAPSR